MADVYSDNLYNDSIIVCNNDIYTNNLMSHSLCSLSDRIILNENLTLQYLFVTPKENQLGYQIIGTIINNNTTIITDTLYNISSITLSHGVWSIFSQSSFKCDSINGSNPLILYNVLGIGLNSNGYGSYRTESYSMQANFNVNSTFSDQVVRINTITSISTLYFNQSIKFQDCSLVTNASQSFLVATRIA